MTFPTVLAATWRDGLFVISPETRHQELAGQPIRAITSDGRGGALAIVNDHSLCRRTSEGEWSTVATHESDLACSVAVGDVIYVGTDDARVLRVRVDGGIDQLTGFDDVPGRETWYPGSAVVNGHVVGPPLGVRSITETSDGSVLLANVHVGGIPRSTDAGETWHPTLDVNSDVHEVCAHSTHPHIVIAAAAIGLCISHDRGASWAVERDGLHAPYCSAVAFSGDDILVSASTDHFATQGAVYRRKIDAHHAGQPKWIEGIADTGCIAARGSALAVADKTGHLYVSVDAGSTWSLNANSVPGTSSILIA